MESGRLERTLDTAEATFVTADSLMVNLQDSSQRLSAILTEVESGDGTAAKLLNDDSLYVTADSTMTSLKRLLDEMRRNPKKYFKLNVMDF